MTIFGHLWPSGLLAKRDTYRQVGYPWKELWKFSWAWHMASMVSHDAKKKKINDHLILTWVCLGEFAFVIWQEIDKKHSLCLGSFQTWTWLFLTRGGVWRAREVRWGSLGAGQVERWAVWVSIGERGGVGGGVAYLLWYLPPDSPFSGHGWIKVSGKEVKVAGGFSQEKERGLMLIQLLVLCTGACEMDMERWVSGWVGGSGCCSYRSSFLVQVALTTTSD